MLEPHDGPDAVLCKVCEVPRYWDELRPSNAFGLVCEDCDGPHIGD